MQKMKWAFSLVFALGAMGSAASGARAAIPYGTPAAAAALKFDPFTLATSAGPVVPMLLSSAATVQAPALLQPLATEPQPETITISVANAPHLFEAPYLKGLKATFVVTLSKPSKKTITVRYATANGTAKAGREYQATGGLLTFKPGELNKIVSVNLLSDDVPNQSDPRIFYLDLSKPTGATISRSRGLVEIFERTDEQLKKLTLVVSNAPPLFEVGANLKAVFTISLSSKSSKPVTVHYATVNDTAIGGSDYQKTSGDLTFQPGQTIRTVTVKVLDNLGPAGEANVEQFFLEISKATGAMIARDRGIALIVAKK